MPAPILKSTYPSFHTGNHPVGTRPKLWTSAKSVLITPGVTPVTQAPFILPRILFFASPNSILFTALTNCSWRSTVSLEVRFSLISLVTFNFFTSVFEFREEADKTYCSSSSRTRDLHDDNLTGDLYVEKPRTFSLVG